MAHNLKQITLFDNYDWYDFEDVKKAILEDSDMTESELSDDEVWDTLNEWEDEDWSNCKHMLEDAFGNNKVIVYGTAGTWHGTYECAKIFEDIERAVFSCVKDCEFFKVTQDSERLVNIRSTHHDGSNNFYLKIVKEEGLRIYDRWDSGKYEKLGFREFDILQKIWNGHRYSKRCEKIY